MSDKKTKQDGDSLVKKLLSSNLTWSVVALIVLIVICTISDHQFLSLSWNKNTGGLSGPLITMLQESARYLMIATGMTLVISTAGIDSVSAASTAHWFPFWDCSRSSPR